MMYARVSLSSVLAFKDSVQDARDYSNRFTRGMVCIDGIKVKLRGQIERIDISIVKLMEAQVKLSLKIKSLQAQIAICIADINRLNLELAALEAELLVTPPVLIVPDGNGGMKNVSNPRYGELQERIREIKAEKAEVERKKQEYQDRLKKAELLAGKILSHIDSSKSMISALKEKQKTCDQLHGELGDIRANNTEKGAAANETLSKIEKIIKSYISIKIKYDEIKKLSNDKEISKSTNIAFSINQNIQHNEQIVVLPKNTEEGKAEEYVTEHGIEFDANGRVCVYDGKTFGGKFNSYNERLDQTCVSDDPVIGRYEGERGESKFIPSSRNAEGIVVIGILKQYGLDGINYINAEPDFEVCSEAVVKIKAMTENRYDYLNVDGMPSQGNFTQADIECANLWNEQKRDGKSDWNAIDVREYRKSHGLTWHEKCDAETMVLVRGEINKYFKHSGGCSECRKRDLDLTGGIFDEQ